MRHDSLISNEFEIFDNVGRAPVRWDPLRIISLVMLLITITSLILIIVLYRKEANQYLISYMDWVESHPIAGIVTFILVNTLLVPLLIPGTLLAILGSFVYGFIYGKLIGYVIIICIVSVANTLGGYLAFLLSRYLFRRSLEPVMLSYKYLRGLDYAFGHHGFKLIILFRLCPVVPYNVFNYVSAVTKVSHRQFFWGSFLGMLPLKAIELVIFINLAVDIANVVEGNYDLGPAYKYLTIFGVVFAIFLIIIIGYVTKKELDNEVMMHRTRISISKTTRYFSHNDSR